MKATLVIKKFGPIEDLNIVIRKFNILIGPHASGKSTISKVLAIIHAFDFNIYSVAEEKRIQEILQKYLVYYRVENFLQKDTYWFFEDEIFSFELSKGQIKIVHKKRLEDTAGKTESYYFPAERIALPMISESLFELTLAQSTLPGYFLQFGKDFTVARKRQRVFNLPILEVEFQHDKGENRVFFRNNQSLLLEETSSAIQANLPLLVILQYPVNVGSLFVVEELELHGFPLLQKKLLYYIVERMKHPKLENAYVMLPTHSPYILSAANNLLFAAKVGRLNQDTRVKVNDIVPQTSWIESEDFSAYYIADGQAISIIDNNTGLIDENQLDSVSDYLADEFDALMDLFKPAIA